MRRKREDNLIDINSRPQEEQRAIRSKGAKAANKARKEKRELRERLETALDMPVKDKETLDDMRRCGLLGDSTYYDAVCAAIITGATHGNVNYSRLLLELIGENPAQRLALEVEKAPTVQIYLPDNGRDSENMPEFD